MPGTDTYQQGYPIPLLSDSPNIEGFVPTINALAPRTNMRFASAAARNAAIPSPVAGMECWLITEGRKEIHDGTTWRPYAPITGYADHVPAWSTASAPGPALGNGILTSRWTRWGTRTIHWYGALTWGSTTFAGTGISFLTPPVPVASLGSGLVPNGIADYVVPGANNYIGEVSLNPADAGGATFVVKSSVSSQEFGYVTNTFPLTHAAGHILRWNITYEAAS
ncbi:hypothetical protein [Kitasatospora sp. NPDC050543]|uniref:hypothetical protein n=1 Tax=Kitasatospora sp. NPDC050543 TaxID=3364054 RepID=UPI00378C1F75